MDLYAPIHSSRCWRCQRSPTVGIKDRHGLIDTELCGECFFQSHEMIDPTLWNEEDES